MVSLLYLHPVASALTPTVQLSDQTNPGLAIEQAAGTLAPIRLQLVQHKSDSRLWNEYIERYHYPGHKPLPGAQLRCFVYTKNQPIALLGFGASAWQTACPPPETYLLAGTMSSARRASILLLITHGF